MKETYRKNLASYSGHEPYAGSSNVPGVAWASGDTGQPLSSEIEVPVCRPCPDKGKAKSFSPTRQGDDGHGGVIDPEHVSKFQAREPGPLLSNCYLHYVFDLWISHWREKRCKGEAIVVRYADDFVIGFEHEDEAQACLEELRERFAKFGLKLHTEKTRLIEFGRYASERREKRGEKRPETFDFLGFTHQCSKMRKDGRFIIHRHSVSKRMRSKLLEIRIKLRKRINQSLGETARWLKRVVQGWLNYHAVPDNSQRMGRFMAEVTRHWLRTNRRRSQRGKSSWTWARMNV